MPSPRNTTPALTARLNVPSSGRFCGVTSRLAQEGWSLPHGHRSRRQARGQTQTTDKRTDRGAESGKGSAHLSDSFSLVHHRV